MEMPSKEAGTTRAEPVEAEPSQHSTRAPLAIALLCACLASWVCFVLNVSWTVWAVLRHPADSSQIGVLYEGSCSKTNSLSMWLHLLINILSTILLAASNYCMQISLAPTREEVDAAHQQHKTLAIGTPSLRNLGKTSSLRTFIWVLLAVGSIPLHLVFNSAVFSAISVTEYAFAVADETFLTNKPAWSVNASRTLTQFARAPFNSSAVRSWDRLTPDECLAAYGEEFVTDRRNVLVVVEPTDRELDWNYNGTDIDDPLRPIPDPLGEHRLEGLYRSFTSGVNAYLAPKHYDWLCFGTLPPSAASGLKDRPGVEDLPASTESSGVRICNPKLLQQQQEEWRIVNLPYDYTVKYCLSEPHEESCRLEYSPIILGIICGANLLKALAMSLLFLSRRRFSALLTIGDAIASFLTTPDSTTAGRSSWSKRDFSPTDWKKDPSPRGIETARKKYGSVPSRLRWTLTVVAIVTALGTLVALLGQGIQADARDASVKFQDLWDRGFGTINTISIIGKGRGGHESWRRNTLEMVILANTPQLLLSIVYYSYNALFTAMWAGAEWANLGKRIHCEARKTLRVSKPSGKQRGTYHLQLPFRLSVPLIILSIILHWLTSQSLFLAKVRGTDSHGGVSDVFITTCGYSNIAIVFAIIAGAVALVWLLVSAALPLSSNMPIVGSSSAAISAACHPMIETVDACQDRIGWGVEVSAEEKFYQASKSDQRLLHLTLTSGVVRAPSGGEVYV